MQQRIIFFKFRYLAFVKVGKQSTVILYKYGIIRSVEDNRMSRKR